MIWKRWDVDRMEDERWYAFQWHQETDAEMKISDAQMDLQSAILEQFTYNWSQGAYLQLVRKARFYNVLHTIHIDTRSFVSSLFFYNMYIQGSGFTFIMELQFSFFSFFHFGNVWQQWDLPLFGCCSGSKCGSFFLLWGVWPGVAFICGHWIEVARVGRVVGMTFI